MEENHKIVQIAVLPIAFVSDCSITDLDTNADLNGNINEVKGEIPNITNLVTNTGIDHSC